MGRDRGLRFRAVSNEPEADAYRLDPVRIGLWDKYGGSEASGWVRFILETFEFPFEVVYPQTLDRGNLRSMFDVLIFVDGAIPSRESVVADPATQPEAAANVPSEYADRLGEITISRTVPQLRGFLESGGSILTIGGSASLAAHLGLPIASALTEPAPDNRPLRRELFYVPGSILEVEVDNTHPLAYGLDPVVDVVFANSPAFRLSDAAESAGIRSVARFRAEPLRSGWAWGEDYLNDAVAVVDAEVGEGRLVLFGPEIAFRAQPHGSFKFLFNGIYYGASEPVRLGAE
jgi:hypothetical protein